MNTRLNKSKRLLIIWKYMMYDISEQYTDDIVRYHFPNTPSDLIYDRCCSFYGRTTIFVLHLS